MIETARADDLPRLAELMVGSPLLRRYGVTFEGALGALMAARAAGDGLLVARTEAGEPVGLAWVIWTRALNRGAYLRLLLVAEAWRGTGLGGRLFEAVEAEARSRANHLYFLVTTDNTVARRFYERRGCRHIGELPGLTAPGLDEALYHKPLRPHGDRLPGDGELSARSQQSSAEAPRACAPNL